MIVIPVATVMAAGIGAGAFAVGLSAARSAPEAVTDDTTFDVSLDGQQEFTTGGVAGAGDPDALGVASITIDTATAEVCVDVVINDVEDLAAMHIHRGPAGVNGPIVVDFALTPVPPGPPTPPDIQKCVTATSTALAAEIAGNPLGFYLNAHTATYPAGAVRGQLEPLASETHLLPTPVRVYDSRVPNSLGTPALESNSTTIVDLTPSTAGSLAPDATAALVTVTVTDVRAAGFLSVYSNALASPPATSTLNWNGHDDAVTTTVKVDATGSVKITIGPDGGADVIIDVLGYLSAPEPPLPVP
ncbi:MAG TPA: CHRD domain-containing protein [Ilumatobacteraceae bacterium]|nr:CHRD domain-containing protein [Ilumatobacteraceae bacterium]